MPPLVNACVILTASHKTAQRHRPRPATGGAGGGLPGVSAWRLSRAGGSCSVPAGWLAVCCPPTTACLASCHPLPPCADLREAANTQPGTEASRPHPVGCPTQLWRVVLLQQRHQHTTQKAAIQTLKSSSGVKQVMLSFVACLPGPGFLYPHTFCLCFLLPVFMLSVLPLFPPIRLPPAPSMHNSM